MTPGRVIAAWASAAAVLVAVAASPGAHSIVAAQASGSAAGREEIFRDRRVPVSTTHVITIRQFRFEPAEVTASIGDTIRWMNEDPVPHTATAVDSTWDSGRIERNGEWTMVVREAGVLEYLCTYHPTMKSVIRVTDGKHDP